MNPIKNPFNLPNPKDPLPVNQIIERNLDLYSDNMRRVAQDYGGQLVTNKGMAGWLMAVLNNVKHKTGEVPLRLTPPGYPLEEFIPLQIAFDVVVPPGVTITAKKWYFVRRARRIRGPDRQAVHKVSIDAQGDLSEGTRGGTDSHNLGFGMVYYGLVHCLKAETVVVLGSGGGFVPRVARQAQLDLGLARSKTYLVDADMGGWGRPDWTEEESFFRKSWPDIEWINKTTEEAAGLFAEGEIEFLHIDADHSRALQDFQLYGPLVRPRGCVTLHDTKIQAGCNAREAIEFIRTLPHWDVVNFDIGVGIGLAYRREW